METKANFVLIGSFTIAVIVAAFALVLFFAGFGRVADSKVYEVLFTGSVSGLSRGGAVLFNGLRVGEVARIDFVPDDPGRVAAFITIESRAPIKADTRARLELQGLTGGSVVALTGGASDAAALEGKGGAPPVIVAGPSRIETLLDNAEKVSAEADAVLTKADRLISDNGAAITDAAHNLDAFSKSLGDNASGIGAALGGVAELGREIGPLADRLRKLSEDSDKLIGAIDPAELKRVVDDAAALSKSLGDDKGAAQSLLRDSAALAKRLNDWSSHINSAIEDIGKLLEELDPRRITGFGDMDRILKNASELAAKLDDSADEVEAQMSRLRGFLGSPDVEGALEQVGDAARSIRPLADAFGTRAREAAAGLARIGGAGPRAYAALAVDGRRAVDDLDRALRGFERNPTQPLLGAEPAPREYHGGN